ncbi:hypothetical protein Gotur_020990 [Gossypium turneri]
MTIYVNREVRLKPKIRIDGTLQRVEYEALPNACFGCGRYDHVQDVSPSLGGRDKGREDDSRKNFDTAELNCRVEKFGSWMLVGRKQRRKAQPKIREQLKKSPITKKISQVLMQKDSNVTSVNACFAFKGKSDGLSKKLGDRAKGKGVLFSGPNKPVMVLMPMNINRANLSVVQENVGFDDGSPIGAHASTIGNVFTNLEP